MMKTLKIIENIIKDHSEIDQIIWFKSEASTLQGVSTLLLSRFSSYLVYKKKRKMRRRVVGIINVVGSDVEVSKVLASG